MIICGTLYLLINYLCCSSKRKNKINTQNIIILKAEIIIEDITNESDEDNNLPSYSEVFNN